MNHSRLSLRLAGVLLTAAALAGCGGGGGSSFAFFPVPPGTGTTSPPTTPAPGAGTGTATPQASAYDQFVAYVVALVSSVQDTAEPADITAYDPPPTSETAEPTATQ
ncbi:hypothetical protein [Pseudacidovorax intermedius]|uniref:Lipoprotein n=1 Tax=Pseudacidovorax intermedius TaxID=433924 RepID=A0A147HBX3_9BURK|nr:hypothetical protein [Pseudacidovorax intermedius]KTT27566.1 hypothetical protein NS331_01540 [Pseudacidovorax intermedius]